MAVDGEVCATADGYAAVYNLVNEPIYQGLEAAVPDHIRQVVEAVRKISRRPHTGSISLAKLSEHLIRDRSEEPV